MKEVNPSEHAASVQVDFEFDSGRSLEVASRSIRDGKPVSGGRYDGKMESMNNWDLLQGNKLTINGYRGDKPRRVQVYHEKRQLVGFQVIEGENPENLTVTLEPWATISGRLLDKAGSPQGSAPRLATSTRMF